MNEDLPLLKPLHPESTLIPGKLILFERLSTKQLQPRGVTGQEDCLRTRPDGTMLEGNHRIHVLRMRGVDVNKLPRDIVAKTEL
jgi:hypothetical protein